jgi:hypothetical protein
VQTAALQNRAHRDRRRATAGSEIEPLRQRLRNERAGAQRLDEQTIDCRRQIVAQWQ